MPLCSKCNKAQSRLNKGGLCKQCLQLKINPENADVRNNDINPDIVEKSATSNYQEDINDKPIYNYQDDINNDISFIEIIKENMSRERIWNEDVQLILKDQIDFLKKEIIVKNTLIESLMIELHDKCPERNSIIGDNCHSIIVDNLDSSLSAGVTSAVLTINSISLNSVSDSDIDKNRNDVNRDDLVINPKDIGISKVAHSVKGQREALILNNRFSVLANYDDICDDVERNDNSFQEVSYNKSKQKKARSTTIIGDSIIKDIKQYKMKKDIPYGDKIHVKSFSGSTVADLTHYVKPSIAYQPDLFIIHGGSNDLRSEKTTIQIAEEIINLASDIKTPNNEVMISGLVYRNDFLNDKGQEVNGILIEKCAENNIYFINNNNITEFDLNGSGLHLNFRGTSRLANNFLDCITL